MRKEKKIRVAGAIATGFKNIEKNKSCQDRIMSKSSNGATIIALADGAGSYQKPEIGAEIVTSFVCDYLIENFNALYKKNNEEIAKELLLGMGGKLIEKANQLKVEIKELSSTLLFVGVKNNCYLSGHIGDGMIGYFENNNAKPLSYPENDEEYTFFPTMKTALKHFRIYKNDLNRINGFILMSDGTYDSLYKPNTKQLTDANVTMFDWLQNNNNSTSKVKSEIENSIKELFLDNSLNRDDCSVNILAITDEKVASKEGREIDMKQVNDNTEKIKTLRATVDSLKTKIDTIENNLSSKVLKSEFDNKLKNVANKIEVNQLQSVIDESSSNVENQDKKVKKIERDLSVIKAEISEINEKINNYEDKTLISGLNTLLEWKKNAQILLIILFLLSAVLTGLIIKLFLS
jgi:hypothetical protein